MTKYQKEDLKKIYLIIKSEYEKSHGSCAKYKNALSRFNTCLKNDNFSEKDIEDLLKTRYKGNWIASVGQGNDEYQQVRKNWDLIYKTIKELQKFDFEQEHPNKLLVDKYQELLKVVSKGCKRQKKIITNRLLVTFFPQYVTTTCDNNDFQTIAKFMCENFEKYPKPQQNWLLDNLDFVKYCRGSFTEDESFPIAYFAWYLHEDIDNKTIYELLEDKTMPDTKKSDLAQKCAELLKNTKNLILHGAPGTGKTYLAREIAKAMGCTDNEIGFVQFHPSYDYTDFVEGLRPVNDDGSNGQIGFERRDGVFKEFCRQALKNKNNFDDAYNFLIAEIMENGNKLELKTPENAPFYVSVNNRKSLAFYTSSERKGGSLTAKGLKTQFEGKPFYKYWLGYYKGVVDYMTQKYGLKQNIDNSKKIFVFIIDEINRGEMGKIFGELFFSIDPEYRGNKGKILTQYANMETEPNEFDDMLDEKTIFGHFFVPDNVYIIGTMNDIDRSVESMDLAMRRRFTFKEIKATDTQDSILSQLDTTIGKDTAKKCMDALNDAIWDEKKKEGELSSSYHIGGAYFLKLNNFKDEEDKFQKLWDYNLEPLLREYLRGQDPSGDKLKKLEDAYKSEGNHTETKH